ncbi:hypothetical protein QUF64_02115 [Anaerolineales bacterium HSG6]|nr:hypothetical protein [Anaerolineales bacterium HSG6]
MSDLTLKINVELDIDDNELAEISELFQEGLLELDVESVERIKDNSPKEGARFLDWSSLDAFTIEMTASLTTPVILYAWHWLRNQTQTTKTETKEDIIKVEIVKGGRRFVLVSTMTEEEVSDIAKSVSTLFEKSV